MGLLNKIKNALFEEEYVEVEEKPKKVKKDKPKKEETVNKEKPVAKKVILPGRKNEKIEELHEEELIDEDFEIRPKDEVKEENIFADDDFEEKDFKNHRKEEFKMLDDDDFKIDEPVKEEYEEPEIVQVIGRRSNNFEDTSKEEDLLEEEYQDNYPKEENTTSKHLYGVSEPEVKLRDYGAYEKKEERGYFRPSPIISPIYGILDKNYRKEDVISKKDVHVASSYSRKRVNIDEVRNKAYGLSNEDMSYEDPNIEEDLSFKVEKDNDKRLVDLSTEDSKPSVKEVTVGDAVEYFQDLGLEYNVDYVDATKETPKKRRTRIEDTEDAQTNEEDLASEPVIEKTSEITIEKTEEQETAEEKPVIKKEKKVVTVSKVETVEPVKEDNTQDKADALLDTSDNLFDLIDSMYQENE